jgi:hypothetical protein
MDSSYRQVVFCSVEELFAKIRTFERDSWVAHQGLRILGSFCQSGLGCAGEGRFGE